ncbi:TPA: DUF3228 domain-containing protein [Candidatus Uhrbacteria bacterium]|nr:DUF3228 domain-containing protein [Candidatus Uhrbacteria bacterium]HAN06687.1 DUF3228 domain-containing protein [Candidatus Uhrbacteria bacterium]HAP66142.1 DUF3228 domain-containing protein [Candidatus Uhrbacteria bacterium]HBA51686.1 DUF3228 domain-containing protein [Candidatus Uhrbacteria bacterium]HBC39768.1 DUF3228 domain-containing protein [Candidatus Uhrbacteria bacterium]
MTKFALGRHFANKNFAGTRIVGMTAEELVEIANAALEAGEMLVDGYAPFCKHLFVRNTTTTTAPIAAITPDNAHLLRSGYEARREGELPVLTRWFEGLKAPQAEWLDIILYNREALEEEADQTPNMERDVPDAEWGIVSINAGLNPAEDPMPPITMMRNALGKEEGGSGVALNREAYLASVEFWNNHAMIR